MKKICVILFFMCGLDVSGQNDPLFSHYMFNPSYYNPGWLGDVKSSFATFHHRTQWAGYTTSFDGSGGAPISQLMSFALPISGRLSTAGVNFIHDQVGIESTVKMQVGAAYTFDLKKGQLSVGMMPTLINRTLRFDELRFENPGDPLNTGTRESQSRPDLAAGVFYNSVDGFFAGIGVDHLLSPSLISIEASGSQISGKLESVYYFHGGKRMDLNRDLELVPTFLLKTSFGGYSLDVSGVLNYRQTMWGGLSYRSAESAVLLLGYNFLENKALKVGYSFDYVVQNQDVKRPTSHEIFVRYEMPSLILGGRKPVKTPRFSY